MVDGEGRLTYRELEVASDLVAGLLFDAGGKPGDVVAVAVPRGRGLFAALLGAMKAGMPYLPISLDDPPGRRDSLVRQAGAAIVLSTAAHAASVATDAGRAVVTVDDCVEAACSAFGPPVAPLTAFPQTHPAYVLYTSGSTGRPKAAVVPIGALCNRLLWMVEEYAFAPTDRTLQKTPATFDVSGWELWCPLVSGGRAIALPPEAHRDPGEVIAWITRHAVTICHFVPSMLDEFVRWPGVRQCASLRMVVCSGEALTVAQVRRFRSVLGAELHNLYGPTEAAIDVTYWRCPERVDALDRVLIGRPITNCVLLVLDDDFGPTPAGGVGQLGIGGMVLGSGYLNRPDLTEAAFVRAPAWSPVPRIYLTGDLVRRHGDDLEYVGRRDDQVKIRGHRVEVAETEHVLREQRGIRDVVVLPVALAGGLELCAVVVPEAAAGTDPREQTRLWAAGRLPTAFVPRYVLPIDRLPLTNSGKCDRRELKRWAEHQLTAGQRHPEGDDEIAIAWRAALGQASPSETLGFRDGGGHSLAAARLAGTVLARWGVRIPLAAFLRDDMSLVELRRLLADATPRNPPMAATPAGDGVTTPISAEQRRLWLWHELNPGCPAYNVVGVLEVAGELDADTLRRAGGAVLARHDALRTTMHARADGTTYQRVHPHAALVPQVAQRAGEPWTTALHRFGTSVAATVFRPGQLPRLALGLLTDGTRSGVVMAVDHLVADQRSLDLLLADLAACYAAGAGDAPPLPDSPPRYLDVLARRPAAEDAARRDSDLRYWRERLAGAPPHLDLPFAAPRPRVTSYAGAEVHVLLDRAESAALDAACRQHGVTAAVLALTGYAATLAAWSGNADLVVGLPVSGRELPDEFDTVGFFVKTVPVRMSVDGSESPADLAVSVAGAVLDAMDHSSVTFDEIVAAARVPPEAGYHPVFQVWFNDLTRAEAPDSFGGHPAAPVPAPVACSLFDLGLYLERSAGGGYVLRLVFSTQLWTRAVADEFLRQCHRWLTRAAGIAVAPPAPAVTVPAVATPATCTDLVRAVLGRADQDPDRPALVTGAQILSYGELAQRLRRVSAAVRVEVGSGRLVAVRAERAADLPAALLGCWHAGHPVLLVPADAPRTWVDSTVAQAGACWLPSWQRSAGGPADAAPVVLRPGDVGHALLTSGTSSSAVVVLLPADALPEPFDWYAGQLGLSDRDVFCFTVPPSHDPVFRDVVLPLTLGARVQVPAAEQAGRPEALLRLLRDSETTVLHVSPSQLAVFAAASDGTCLPHLRHVVFHGERLSEPAVRAAAGLAPQAEMFDLYGTTETPQASLLHAARPRPVDSAPGPAPPVGAMPHRIVRIVTPRGDAEVGEVGELVVVGRGLALGYVGESGRTPPEPVDSGPGVRRYRTGDLARRDLNGAVEVLGRRDRQVSLRGHRIQLDGVERVLGGAPGVVACAVAPDPTGPGGSVAWFVTDGGAYTMDLGRYLRERLPEWAVPDRFIRVRALPMTRHGKVDVGALVDELRQTRSAPAIGQSGPGADRVTELIVQRARQQATEPDAVGPDTTFYEGGLGSFALVRLHAELTGAGLELPLAELFRFPTPRTLAAHLAGAPSAHARTEGAQPRARPDDRHTQELAVRRAARRRFQSGHRDG